MSARTVAEERASIHMALDQMYEGYDELSELLDDLLRAHAHELAEEIRQRVSDGRFCVSQVDGAWESANLIDPEVSA
jgi:hypothetical protein